jgi:CHAT domain-containing protein
MALSNLSLSYQKLGQWQLAEKAINQSLNLLENNSTSVPTLLAQVLSIQGNLYLETGQPEQALESWTKATDLYTQVDRKNDIIQSQINQAQALQELGFYPKACQTLIQALNIDHLACEWSPQLQEEIIALPTNFLNSLALTQLGSIFKSLGDFPASIQVLTIALEQAQQVKNTEQIAKAYLLLGESYQAQLNSPAFEPKDKNKFINNTLEFYSQAAETSNSALIQIQAQLKQLNLLFQNNQQSEFQVLLPEIKEKVINLSLSQSSLNAQFYLIETLIQSVSNLENITNIELDIQQLLTDVTAKAQQLQNPRLIAYSLGLWGKYYELKQDFKLAENSTVTALNTLSSYQNDPDIAYQFLWQLGRIRKATGKTKQATANYTQAVSLLKNLRKDIIATGLENRFNFRENIEPIYRELIGLRLQQNPSPLDLKESIDLIESLQIQELNNFFQVACVEEETDSNAQIDTEAAIFYPIILQDRLEIIVALPNQPLLHYSAAISASELEQTYRQIRRKLGFSFRERDLLPIAKNLYNLMIQPIQSDLKQNQITTLVFSLDGILRKIPMAFLHDGNQYLIEQYKIATTIPGLKTQNLKSLDTQSLNLLVAGLSDASQDFPPLPAVENEVEQIIQQFPTSTVLFNDEFTSSNLQEKMRQVEASIVHLATHGQFSSNRDETFILTATDKIKINDFERLLKTRTEDGTNPIELLILSACQTAAGDNRAILGLAGVAVRSGARSTLATLWPVSDESTAQFMTTFYQKIAQPNISKADAIRLAQLDLLERGYRQPFFWAPFILVGDWS